MLRSDSRDVALAALRCAPAASYEIVLERTDDRDAAIRAAALEAMAQMPAAAPLDAATLAKIVSDEDAGVRRAGVMLMANANDPEWFGALAAALGDVSQEVRFAAEKVLGSMGKAGVGAVEPMFRAPTERCVESALRVVDAADLPDSREILKHELRRRVHELWRGVIGFQLLPGGDDRAVEFLRVAFADAIMRHRRTAFRILELLEDPKVVRRVDRALHSGSPRARGDALEVLSHLGDREAAGLLVLIQETGPLADRRTEAAEFVILPNSATDVIAEALQSESRWIAMAARSIDPAHERNVYEENLMERLLALKQVPLFSQLSLEQLEAIQQISLEVEYLADEAIFKEGDRGGDLYLLIEGAVRIVKDFGNPQEMVLKTVDAVSYFGEMAALDDERRSATVVAAVPCRLLRLEGASLKELIHQMPEISFEIMRVLIGRVREAERRSADT
jgi:HEAT repeat protein